MQGVGASGSYNKNTFYQLVAKAGLNETSYFKNLSAGEQKIILNMYSKLKSNGKK